MYKYTKVTYYGVSSFNITLQTEERTDIGKYSFVNRSITDWNQLPEGVIGTSYGKNHIFKTRVRKV